MPFRFMRCPARVSRRSGVGAGQADDLALRVGQQPEGHARHRGRGLDDPAALGDRGVQRSGDVGDADEKR
jgi:hypothetical protein